MFQGLWLSIKNKFRNAANANTDIAGAGREHISNVQQRIKVLTNQRDEIAADGVLLEQKIKQLQTDLDRYAEAVRHWNGKDEVLMKKAYVKYQAAEKELNALKKRNANITERVRKIDEDLNRIKAAKDNLKDNLEDAAIIQASGRINSTIEEIHESIDSGPLAGAIEYAKRSEAKATASRTRREGDDESDMFGYEQTEGTSLADLLGENTKSTSSSRGHTSVTTPIDESPYGKNTSHLRGTGAALLYADEDSFIPKESSPVGVSEHHRFDSGTSESHRSDDSSSSSSSSSSTND